MTSPPPGTPQARLYSELDFCSNTLIGVKIPIVVDDVPMLVLGYGDVPLVWLTAPSDPKGERWVEIVRESTSLNESVNVERDVDASAIRIKIGGQDVLEVSTVSQTKARVLLIDFRVLGIPIWGNQSGLQIGGTS